MKPSKSQQADRILSFLTSLNPDFELPPGVEIMNPYTDRESFRYVETFYRKYYSDDQPRYFIFGINPGRHGGGITGIPFTDPVKLEKECGIENPYLKKGELSADFIYQMIRAFGGADKFYKRFFITAMSPLGFTRGGKNLNYYDDRQLCTNAEEFITSTIKRQLSDIPSFPDCFCLGEGENFRYFAKLNERYGFFRNIYALPHPRWVMQYKRKSLEHFIGYYLEKFMAAGMAD